MTQASCLATVGLAVLAVRAAVGAPAPPPGARPPVTGARPGATAPAAPSGAVLPSERALVSPGSVAVFPFEKPPPAPPPQVSAPRDLGDMIAAQIRQGLDDS